MTMQGRLKRSYILQWLLLAALMLPVFLQFLPSPPKREIVTVKPLQPYYTVIPLRAVALINLTAYKDENLRQEAEKIPVQTHLSIADLIQTGKRAVFKLANGEYVLAAPVDIGSDVTLTVTKLDTTVLLKDPVNVLYSPFTTYDDQVYSTLPANQALTTLKKATTHWGTYYEVSFNGGQTGWIDAKQVGTEADKFAQLQQLLTEKYSNQKYSIYVKQLDGGLTAGVNTDEKMYSASLSKLPILYWTQKRINAGLASLGDPLKYTAAVNAFPGAFKAQGTGTLPDQPNDKDYSLLDVINRTAKDSDNVGSNILAYYETNKFSDAFKQEITKIAGWNWNPTERDASSEMVCRVLEKLYDEGGASFNALFDTDYDKSRIMAAIPPNVRVAHKIGSADQYNHDAAVVFASQPYILVVETNGGTDADITAVSQTVYGVLA